VVIGPTMVFAVQAGASNMGDNARMRIFSSRATLSLSKTNSMPFTWKHRLPLPKDGVHPWYGLDGSGRVEPVGVEIRWPRAGIKREGPVKERMLDQLENEEAVVVEKEDDNDDDIDDEDDEVITEEGFNGADLCNVCTEAGMSANRAERDYVIHGDFMKETVLFTLSVSLQ
ncbi:hypothetical protein Tco_0784529, partial [Tanacetum coccineum]